MQHKRIRIDFIGPSFPICVNCSLNDQIMAHQRYISIHIYSFLKKLEHNNSCDLGLTSDCGHKLTFDPPPAPRLPCVTEGHTKLPAVVEGSRQRVPIRPGHGHASVRMRGPIRKQCKRQRKRMGRKGPPCHFLALCRLTFDPCPVAWS